MEGPVELCYARRNQKDSPPAADTVGVEQCGEGEQPDAGADPEGEPEPRMVAFPGNRPSDRSSKRACYGVHVVARMGGAVKVGAGHRSSISPQAAAKEVLAESSRIPVTLARTAVANKPIRDEDTDTAQYARASTRVRDRPQTA